MQPVDTASSFTIGDVLVIPSRNRMVVKSVEHTVEPVAMNVLLRLADARGEVVTRSELLESVWPEVVVEDSNLSKAISAIRKVLQFGSHDQRFIETVPKVGYRLIQEVIWSSDGYPRADAVRRTAPGEGGNRFTGLSVLPQIRSTTTPRYGREAIPLHQHLSQVKRLRRMLVATSTIAMILLTALIYTMTNKQTMFEEALFYQHADGTVDSVTVRSESPIVLNTSFSADSHSPADAQLSALPVPVPVPATQEMVDAK